MLGETVHDIRGTITTIISLNRLLRQKIHSNTDEEFKQIIEFIDIKCELGLTILTNLLIIDEINSTANVVKKQTISSLSKFIHQQVGGYKIQAKIKEIELVINTPSKEIFCQIDQLSLTRIFDNLISNAIKFTPRKGTIKIIVEEHKDDVVIKISDTGVGIPNEHHKTIFDKYTRARQKGTENEGSNGLGLYIVKKIIELNNGNIFIASEVNKGTIVTIMFNNIT